MIRLAIISVACAAWTLIGCTPTRVRQDVWPQPAGIDAPSWPAASNPQPLPERMAKSHLALDESHSSGAASVTPTAVSSFPAVPPADADATLLPVAPRRLLVLFTAPKCKPCDDLKRLLAQCESQVYGDFVFREVDITTFDVGLNSAPWLALFDAGTERQIEGPTAAPKTLGGLKELLTRWGTL